jgi:zinc finger MYND domain-containing protein 10
LCGIADDRSPSKKQQQNNNRTTTITTNDNNTQVLLFHGHACAAGGDALVDLLDYLASHVALLNSGELQRELTALAETEEAELRAVQALPDARARAEALAARAPSEALRRQEVTLRFQTAVAAVGVLRCLCSHAERDLPLPALSRLVQTHDLPLALVPLIENPPWTRRRERSNNTYKQGEKEGEGGRASPPAYWEKYVDFSWQRVANKDLLLLTKAEAQPWLALFHLVASGRVRERYHLNAFRKGQLLRVRRYLHEALLDQLPVLADVRRFLDEAALLDAPEPTAGPAAFLLEEVAAVRAAVLAGVPGKEGSEARVGWCAAVAERQLREHFAAPGGDARDEDLKALAAVYGPEWVDAVLATTSAGAAAIVDTEEPEREREREGQRQEEGACGHCGKAAAKRCGRCQQAWYCGRACQAAAWTRHRKACGAAAAAAAKQQVQQQE